MENTFKTVVVGGFHKQDVIRYIEQTAQESRERLAELEQERNRLLADKTVLEGELDHLRQDLAESSEERARLLTEKADLTQEGEKLLRELEAVQKERDGLQSRVAELEPLAGEVESLRQLAREYEASRAHMMDVELEARRRADEIGREAQEEADTLRRETEESCAALRERLRENLCQVSQQCGSLKMDFTTITEHISGELRKMDVAVSQLPVAFHHLQDGLAALQEELAE